MSEIIKIQSKKMRVNLGGEATSKKNSGSKILLTCVETVNLKFGQVMSE